MCSLFDDKKESTVRKCMLLSSGVPWLALRDSHQTERGDTVSPPFFARFFNIYASPKEVCFFPL